MRFLCCSRTGHDVSHFLKQLLVGKATLQEFKAPCIWVYRHSFFAWALV